MMNNEYYQTPGNNGYQGGGSEQYQPQNGGQPFRENEGYYNGNDTRNEGYSN